MCMETLPSRPHDIWDKLLAVRSLEPHARFYGANGWILYGNPFTAVRTILWDNVSKSLGPHPRFL